MKHSTAVLRTALALTVLGSAYAGAADAGDRVSFSISLGVPAPYYGPPVIYAPPPVVYVPPVVYAPPPYYGARVVVSSMPRYVVDYGPRGYVSWGYREHRHWDRGQHRGWRER
jgi:hypothetical protein